MKSFILAAAALFSAVASAQYNITSAPFQLITVTHNATYNGSVLNAGHEGAAIEGLLISPANSSVEYYNTFHFNTSIYSTETNPPYGILTWILRGGNFNESEPLVFTYNPDSNVVHPQFEPSYGQQLAFDKHNRLVVPDYVDDSVYPAAIGEKTYDRWYICHTNTEGYQYTTVNWVAGKYPPQNPTCVKTQVVRRFI